MRHNKAFSSGTRGFTLIELLVVVAIIGLLSSVILASLNGARLKGRDARRLSDIKQMQVALELYYDDNGNKYPPSTGAGSKVANIIGLTPKYISVLPHDPNKTAGATGDYQYWTNVSNQVKGYSMMIYIERISDWCRVTVGEVIPNESWRSKVDCSEALSVPLSVG